MLTGLDQSSAAARRLVEQADGRLVLAGVVQGKGVALARFTEEGRIDQDFGNKGRLISASELINSAGLILDDSGTFTTASGGSDVLLTRHLSATVKPFAAISPSRGRLRVLGTEGPDEIQLTQEAPAGRALVVTRGTYSQRFASINVRSIEINSSGGDDTVSFSGISIPAVIRGGPGRDIITGSEGDDRIYGDAGDDVLTGGPGFDRVFGGTGNDMIFARDGGEDLADGGPGADSADLDDDLDRRRSIEALLA
jgi:Ca2+-binding RTX toxin-like protein